MLRAYGLIASVVVAGCTPTTPGGTGGTLPTPRATDVGTPSGSPVEKTIGPAGGTLVVTVDVANARIEIDGKVVADFTDRASLAVGQDGPHTVRVTAPGRPPVTRTVTVRGGATVEAKLTLPPPRKPRK